MRRLLFQGESLAALALASLLIAVLPFRRVARAMAVAGGERSTIQPAAARRIEQALRRWSARVPWHAMCFQQALAAQLMLRRRDMTATIYYGAAHDAGGKLVAHVWVRSGPVDVIGCDEIERYALLATFPPR